MKVRLRYLVFVLAATGCKFIVDLPPGYSTTTTTGQPPTGGGGGGARDSAGGGGSHDSTPPTPPPSGGAAVLDFSLGSTVVVPLSPYLLLQQGTLELWLKPRSAAGGYREFLMGAWGDSGHASLALTLERGRLSFLTHNAIDPTSFFVGPPLSDNVWQFVAVSFSGGTATLFVNGVAAGSAAGL